MAHYRLLCSLEELFIDLISWAFRYLLVNGVTYEVIKASNDRFAGFNIWTQDHFCESVYLLEVFSVSLEEQLEASWKKTKMAEY